MSDDKQHVKVRTFLVEKGKPVREVSREEAVEMGAHLQFSVNYMSHVDQAHAMAFMTLDEGGYLGYTLESAGDLHVNANGDPLILFARGTWKAVVTSHLIYGMLTEDGADQ